MAANRGVNLSQALAGLFVPIMMAVSRQPKIIHRVKHRFHGWIYWTMDGAKLIFYTMCISIRVIDITSVETEQSMKYMLDSIAVSVFVQYLYRI